MQVVYLCPRCSAPARQTVDATSESLRCPHCDWSRAIDPEQGGDQAPTSCLVCGCEDLWRQKDFPQRLGLLLVVIGIVLSTIAYALWRPLLALGILMLFALVDLLLYTCMDDVLVCYRCRGRHRGTSRIREHPPFDLELAERYRQEARRLADAGRADISRQA